MLKQLHLIKFNITTFIVLTNGYGSDMVANSKTQEQK